MFRYRVVEGAAGAPGSGVVFGATGIDGRVLDDPTYPESCCLPCAAHSTEPTRIKGRRRQLQQTAQSSIPPVSAIWGVSVQATAVQIVVKNFVFSSSPPQA